MIKRIPLPVTGVMLGLAALGNLIQSYSEGLRLLCGVAAGILGVLFIVKVILYPAVFKEDMQNPIMASVSGTFPMALMLLAGYVKPLIGHAALYLWYLAIALHVALILYFTVRFVAKLSMQKVFASYYIVYVGIAVAGVTAPAFEKMAVGAAAFWFGFVTFLLLLILVTYRYIKFRAIPEPARPLFCIYTAPAALCLAAYIQSAGNKAQGMVVFLAVLSTLIYIVVLIRLPGFLRMKFYPSYAAFTFPFVITAIGLKMTAAFLVNTGHAVPALGPVVMIETIIAAVLVVYTLIRFLTAVVSTPEKSK